MNYNREIEQLNKNIRHVTYYENRRQYKDNILIEDVWRKEKVEEKPASYAIKDEDIIFKEQDKVLVKEKGVVFETKPVYRFEECKHQSISVKQTANGEVIEKEHGKQILDYIAYKATVTFEINSEEILLGLGQMDGGSLNLRNRKEYLYQTNMRIAVPFLVSSANYGILIDTESPVIYENNGNIVTFEIEVTDQVSYYIISGANLDEIIYWLRELTGKAELLPRWTFGYIQSKEKYTSGKELENTVKKFRKENIPIDCIVQDWQSWENNMWGEKTPDRKRYPDMNGILKRLHREKVKLMWSIWPNMSPDCNNYKAFKERNLLLANSNVYNAFLEKGRKLYWSQCENGLFQAGIDAWWCDNSEPFSDAEWNGAEKREEEARYNIICEESKLHMPWDKINSYGLYHAKGIYEGWRRTDSEKRVVNLSRSTYISGQRYGVIPWSGDISARWDIMRQQIIEGLRMALSGFPYWTFDIGGFFTVGEKWQNRGCNNHLNSDPLWFWKGDYNDGVKDLGYQELYTRWLQLGMFLPVFRSHGTDTPREPWEFCGENNLFYNVIVKYINLRYKLLPYIYSTAAAVYRENYTMMRSFLFDFPNDRQAVKIEDSFMFGKFLLIAPVTVAMYYEKNNKKIQNSNKIRCVYLPKGELWYDFWTRECFEGGCFIEKEAPIDTIPVYVRAGAIIPFSESILYADERNGEISCLLIYEGANGEFTVYNDEGDNYSYQNYNYCAISFKYNDSEKCLTFETQEGIYPCQKEWKIIFVRKDGSDVSLKVRYDGNKQMVKII